MKFAVSFYLIGDREVCLGMNELPMIPPIGTKIYFKSKVYKVINRIDYLNDELGYDCSAVYVESAQ